MQLPVRARLGTAAGGRRRQNARRPPQAGLPPQFKHPRSIILISGGAGRQGEQGEHGEQQGGQAWAVLPPGRRAAGHGCPQAECRANAVGWDRQGEARGSPLSLPHGESLLRLHTKTTVTGAACALS